MYNCFDIAYKLLEFGKEEGIVIPQMKLLKLTYIAHGYYLGFFDKPLFEDDVQAWKFGPVIPNLYQVTKRFGNRQVDSFIIKIYTSKELSKDDEGFLKLVWNSYKKLGGLELSTLTHKDGTPWSLTFKDGIPDLTIDNEVIKKYYKNLISEQSKSVN